MTAFHRGLKAGLAKDEALRRAMLSVRNDPKRQTAHPFYWAAFFLTGDPAAVRFTTETRRHGEIGSGRG